MVNQKVTLERIREGFKQFETNLQIIKECAARIQEIEQEVREALEKNNG